MLGYEGVQVSEQKSTNENLVRGLALVVFSSGHEKSKVFAKFGLTIAEQ